VHPFETANDGDEMTKLKEALAKAETQIAQLKIEKTVGKGPGEAHELHARPLGPQMMPGIQYLDRSNNRCEEC
jgi:hypothetical protein